jgi:SPP1 gp7 family putative phage head morphogenesis protein
MPELPKNISLEPLPFEEAIAFFADKIPMTIAEFYALAEEMRARGFTVARVTSMDVIMDIFDTVSSAIDTGETLADFQGRLDGIMAARGWEGLTPWHAETVFRNNIQTAYSVGRWDQVKDSADRFYGEYDAVNDSHTRPTHAALDGKIFPMDSPFWDTWWPPNGHRCRCGVNPVHKYVVEEEGLKVETDDPTNTLIEPKDPRTGQKMPARYLMPDDGWDTHPGKTEWKPDLSKYPEELKNKFRQDQQD